MTFDTGRELAIKGSPWKLLGLVLAGLAMTSASGALALGWLPGLEGDIVFRGTGWIGFVFFGFCTAIAIWRIRTMFGPVVALTSEGIRDIRLSADLIPWSAVTDISTWRMQDQKIMVLAVDPAVEAQLRLTTIARWTRGANRRLGADGLCIAAQGLAIDYDDLLDASIAYARAARRTA